MTGARRRRMRGIARVLASALILVGLIMIGSAAASIGTQPQHADIEHQRARIEQMEAISSAPIITVPGSTTAAPDRSNSAAGQGKLNERPGTTRPIVPLNGGLANAGHGPTEASTPAARPSPVIVDMPPATHIAIPAVAVDADVIAVAPATVTVDGQLVQTWNVADWAAGHHVTSADPGEGGNIVIAGHDDVRGEVFRGLHDIEIGDAVVVTSPAGTFQYVVAEVHLRREKNAPLQERLAAGQFMAAMPEERLTLITCWPYGVDDHRLIVVAKASPVAPIDQ